VKLELQIGIDPLTQNIKGSLKMKKFWEWRVSAPLARAVRSTV